MVSAERGSESFSFQLKQNITYEDCRHDNRAPTLETLQITMERVFVMYVKEERILRYAITNKISPVGGESDQKSIITMSQRAGFTGTRRTAAAHRRTTALDSSRNIHPCSFEKERNSKELFPESKLFFR